MIAAFRQLPEALRAIAEHLHVLCKLVEAYLQEIQEHGGVEDRVDALERTLGKWEGEMEAQLTRAESRFAAARASEERTRHLAKSIGGDDDEALAGDEEGEDGLEEYVRLLQESDATGGEEEGVQPVRGRVASPSEVKAELRRMKLGV